MAIAAPTCLADKSALARLRHQAVAAVLTPLIMTRQLATCGVLDLEMLFSARGHRDFLLTLDERRSYPYLEADQIDFDRAIDVMELLARRGQHRAAGLPDLLLAAIAERHRVTLLHYDSDFEVIVAATGQPAQWVVPRGSVP